MKTLYKYCVVCKVEGHDLLNCSNIFFLKDAINVISKIRINNYNFREIKERKN